MLARFLGLILVALAILCLCVSPAGASGCYVGHYSYGQRTVSYGSYYPSATYYASPYYVFQASYAPDPDSKVKDLKHDLELQKLKTELELLKTKTDLENLKRDLVSPRAPAAEALPGPKQQSKAPAPSEVQVSQAPAGLNCAKCHDKSVAQQKADGKVLFDGNAFVSPEAVVASIKAVVEGKMPPGKKLDDPQKLQAVAAFNEALLQFATAAAAAPSK